MIAKNFHIPIFDYNFLLLADCTWEEASTWLLKRRYEIDVEKNKQYHAAVIEFNDGAHALCLVKEKSRSIIRHEVSHLVLSILRNHRQIPQCDVGQDEIYRLTEDYVYKEIITYLKKRKFRLKE